MRTVEHLMSALHGLGITNLLVKTDDEVPALDGSALEFCRQICRSGDGRAAGRGRAGSGSRARSQVGNDGEFIRVEPADHLIVDYTLDYPHPIGAPAACISS